MPEANRADEHKAFVISPIGDPMSPERIHADWVLDSIIKPACSQAAADGTGFVVDRGEQAKRPGDIMEHVVESLIHDRIVFAILAFDRPNVYYELALANAAGRHVIMLRHNLEKTHFDIAGLRAISYRYPMEGEALADKIAEVADYVRTVMKMEAFRPTVFNNNLNPLGRLYREYEFKSTFKDVDIPSYCEIFLQARKFIGLQGITLLHFARSNFLWNTHDGRSLNFFDLVRAKVLFDTVDVRVVMMHEDNAALPHFLKFLDRDKFTDSLKAVREEIKQSFAAWSALRDELNGKASERADGRKGKLEVIRLEHGVVNYRLTVTDQQLIVTPYLNIFPFNSQGPALICQAGTPFYDRINREFIDRAVSNEMAAAALKEHGSLEIKSAPRTG
jgi:hypothetical protein